MCKTKQMKEKKIYIIGGGRWARTIAIVLTQIIPPETQISMHSPSNGEGLRAWVLSCGYDRIEVSETLPDFSQLNNPVIIANNAKNHFPTALTSILAGNPTLVEKPFTTNGVDSAYLVDIAARNKSGLYCAHVFFYANYLSKFCRLVKENGPFKQVNIHWADSINETREGVKKRYDASISVIQDVFPHIFTIIKSLSEEEIKIEDCILDRQGLKATIKCILGSVPSVICLERDSRCRKRIIDVKTIDSNFTLDFTIEPGVIRTRDYDLIGDDNWGKEPGPLSLLLKSFLQIAYEKGKFDSRLNPLIALEANKLIDQIIQISQKEAQIPIRTFDI